MLTRFTLNSTYDGLAISVALMTPDSKPKAILQFVHGMCGIKERFFSVMEHFTSEGYICIANDHRGHGDSIRSEKDRGYMYKGGYNALVSDIKMVSEHIKGLYPELPLILIGHSMGALASRIYIKRHDDLPDGLILCSTPSYNKAARAGIILSSILPARTRTDMIQKLSEASLNKEFKDEGPLAWTCSDKDVRESFRTNPKCDFAFTANAGKALMKMMIEAHDSKGWKVSNPLLPILLLSGSDDPCAREAKGNNKTLGTLKEAGYRDIKSITYPGMRHEILNEREKAKVWEDIDKFVKTIIS